MENERKMARTLKLLACLTGVVGTSLAYSQIPDLLNALDSGGRAMGMGGATRVTDATTMSALDNPAGLGYIGDKGYTLNTRTLPTSSTNVTGDFNNRTNNTTESPGKFAVTHLGYTMPFGGGTLGFSYTAGGYVNNVTFGNNLPSGALTVRNLVERTHAKTDFFALSYGRRSGKMNIGYGIVLVNQYVRSAQSFQLFDSSNTQVGSTDTDASGNSYGVGVVAGLQGDMGNGNMQWGLSLRSPVELSGNTTTSSIYDRVPGKASLGLAGSTAGAGREDYLVWALQGDYYFGGKSTSTISRNNVFGFGAGIEYNLHRFGARIPVRVGFQYVPSGGAGFNDRNAFTMGIGYRPNNSDFSLDLSLAKPSNGTKMDIALSLTFRPSK